MLDRAIFPRDKPCGGGVTFRADIASGIDLSPVTEREIYGVRVSADLGNPFERRSPHLLARMTQRSRLDEFLVQGAAEAGSEFRDGQPIREITTDGYVVRVRANGDAYSANILIGADGVNGAVAKTIGLRPSGEHAVAFEANYPATGSLAHRWESMIALDLGGIPGGYGWVFPKADHLNIGVGGWKSTGPTLRARLDRYTRFLRLDPAMLHDHRGYQLPLRRDGEPVVRGPVMLAGDAAALVDPLSGEGIWAAFVSGRLAAEEAQHFLAGKVPDLSGYQRSLEAEMRAEILASRRLMSILQRLPAFSVLMLKYNNTFWRYLQQIIRGDLTYPDLPKKLGPFRHLVYRWADWEIARHRRDLER
jgi:geranylgeranyl reductase family protein